MLAAHLKANIDSWYGLARDTEFLAAEHTRLQTIVAEIPDEATRGMFLENVAWNAEVVAAWPRRRARAAEQD